MNRAQLTASLAKWKAKATYRRRRWRKLVKTRPEGDADRMRWFELYDAAHDMVRKRRRQISRLPVTHIDAAGVALLRREEGVRNSPYLDSQGHCTTGVGHLLHRGRCTAREAARRYSDAEVNAILRRDIARFERAVRRAFKGRRALKATHNRVNSAVSLAFNIGEGGFRSSTVAKQIRAGNERAAADAFLLWDNPSELRPRRERERKLFLS